MTLSTDRFLFALLLVLSVTCGGLFEPNAHAQGNPLDRPAGGGDDAAFELPIYFEGDGLTVGIERIDEKTGQIAGRLMLGDNVFDYTAAYETETLVRGTFQAGEDSFEFTAEEDVKTAVITFTTGETTYRLREVKTPTEPLPKPKPSNPLDGGDGGGQPVQPQTPANAEGGGNAIIGTWKGSGTDQLEDGTPLTFPIELTIARSQDGGLTADLRSAVDYPVAPGEVVVVTVTGRFSGRAPDAGAMVELHAADVTATAQGERASIGAQAIRLQPVQGTTVTGTMGNDRDGWTPIELEKQGGASPHVNPSTSNNVPTDPTRDRQPVSAPQGTVVLEKVSLRDPGMDNIESHTLLKPQGWQVQGGQQWNVQAFRDFVHLNLRVTAPDGRELAVYPGGFYEDSNVYEISRQLGAQVQPPQPGQVTGDGITHMPLPESASAYVTNVVIPTNRPGAQNVRVVTTTELPQIARQVEELMAPVMRNAERDDQQLRQMGAQIQRELSIIAERVRLAYTENGQAFEEDVWVVGSVQHTAQLLQQGMPMTHIYHWTMNDPRGVRAPAGQLDEARALIEAISLSIQRNPHYAAVIMDLQHKINMQQLDALARRGEIARQGREEAWNTYQKGVRKQQAAQIENNRKFLDYIRDVDHFRDTDGSTVNLPSLYSNVYSNGNGEYILTNEPTYDPNDDPNSLERWERINPAR